MISLLQRVVFIETNLHKKKLLFSCSYNPHKNNISKYLKLIRKSLDMFSTKHNNIILLWDFNVCFDDETMKTFCKPYCLKSLIKQPTCFKNLEQSSCMNLIITNRPRSFRSTCHRDRIIGFSQNDHTCTKNCTFKSFHQNLFPTEISRNLIVKGL